MRVHRSAAAAVLAIGLLFIGASSAGAQTRPTRMPGRVILIAASAPQYAYGYGYCCTGYGVPSPTVAAYYKPTYSVTPSYYTSNQSLAIVGPVDPTTYGWSYRLWNREWTLRALLPGGSTSSRHRLYMSEPSTTRDYNAPPDAVR